MGGFEFGEKMQNIDGEQDVKMLAVILIKNGLN